ncbi:hypothetical protein L226DRAFT_399656 [Lentinus tigrinus ALCF2SS1-7]|uniref:uncharacterized protein n=1 Tax=Lentinus tigrinus ALCF2SS1-7 TaxID=1328758 RepID=UPI0011662EE8|nr:hypothetical protein L226DRAFT_399656 [Lentinus tigrinus ALCF2SS1-7]
MPPAQTPLSLRFSQTAPRVPTPPTPASLDPSRLPTFSHPPALSAQTLTLPARPARARAAANLNLIRTDIEAARPSSHAPPQVFSLDLCAGAVDVYGLVCRTPWCGHRWAGGTWAMCVHGAPSRRRYARVSPTLP